MEYPSDRKYTKEHEWAKVSGNEATIGITHHAQDSLGDIVFVELPAVGKKLGSGDTFGVVESVKAVSDLYCPLAGTVTAINQETVDNPGLLNSDPHEGGWLLKLSVEKPGDLESLMDSSAYSTYAKESH